MKLKIQHSPPARKGLDLEARLVLAVLSVTFIAILGIIFWRPRVTMSAKQWAAETFPNTDLTVRCVEADPDGDGFHDCLIEYSTAGNTHRIVLANCTAVVERDEPCRIETEYEK